MSLTSKTGLLASPKKKIFRLRRAVDISTLAPCAVTRQVQLSLRPFGGLFNPYAKSCSILCNHPASIELKNTVKEAKEAWLVEGKAFLHRCDEALIRGDEHVRDDNQEYIPDHVPEEFFRRYTDTDSRPLTPTPTVASGRTRTSAGGSLMNARRCVTPEPLFTNIKERKQLILDLRRSHSQETLFWNASSELSPAPTQEPWSQKNDTRRKAIIKKKSVERPQQISPPLIVRPDPEPLEKEDSQTCINARDDEDDDDEPRRRGKKRKKSKTQSAIQTSFRPNQDPETQVATLGPDSPNLSTRPSLIPDIDNEIVLQTTQAKFNTFNIHEENRSACFLDEDSLKVLRRGLNLDMVENTFECHLNRALKEAYLSTPQDKINFESDVVKRLRSTMNLPEINHDRWIKLPRKYSRSASRFELPIDSSEFSHMTPLTYLSKNVTVAKAQKQIYRRVFLRFLPEETDDTMKALKPTIGTIDDDDDDEIDEDDKNTRKLKKVPIELQERLIPINSLKNAMKEALGFHGTIEKIDEILEILVWKVEKRDGFNFRLWCAIVAFAERYLNRLDRNVDPCNEIEIADFESLERRITSIDVSEKLINVLTLIKYK